MTEEAKTVSAVLSAVCAVLGLFILGIVLEPVAIITGIIGATSKKVGIKATGIAGAVVGGILLIYLIYSLVVLQTTLNSLKF